MNLRPALLLLLQSTVALATYGSLSPLPPSSETDGVLVLPPQQNASAWLASSLADYAFVEGDAFATPTPGTLDGYGRRWSSEAPDLSQLHRQAGTIRIIALGASPTWTGAFGYTYSGDPSLKSYSLALDCGTLSFGDNAAVSLAYGDTQTFDLWLDGMTATHCLFGATARPDDDRSSVRWLGDPLSVSTYIPALEDFAAVDTWVVSIDEAALTQRFAVQFFYAEGHNLPFPPAVPEPSAVGACGAFLLLGAALWRAKRRTRTS